MPTDPSRFDPAGLPERDYAYLLGIYLGDGHIVRCRRDVFRLTIACDATYPGLISAAVDAVRAVLPSNRVGLAPHPVHRCVRVRCYSKLLPQLFPQHGPGRKHLREIKLSDWQTQITQRNPQAFVRGLMHSDGSRFVARQRVGDKAYYYARYAFANRSEDIKRILCDHLDLLEVGWTRPNAR